MPNDDLHPGEEHHYGQGLQSGEYNTGDIGIGPKGTKVQPKKPKSLATIAIQVLSILVVLLAISTGVLFFALTHQSSPTIHGVVARPTPIATQTAQPTTPTLTETPTSVSTPSSTPTSASTPSSTSTVQSSSTVADGLFQKNITLTCSGCNDPIRVTINTIQIDNANGRMIWDTTLKDVTGSGAGFNIPEYDLQTPATQTNVHAVLSQLTPSGSNNQYDMHAIFAFVPYHNVTYTLTVVIYFGGSGGVTITFDPVKITF